MILVAAALLYGIYRRVRRTIGPQPLLSGWLYYRLVIYALITAFVLASTVRQPLIAAAGIAGLAAGSIVGFFALRSTQFESRGGRTYFTVHPYFGFAMLGLFLLRIIERVYVASALMAKGPPGLPSAQGGALSGAFSGYSADPWTILPLVAFTGYYLYYYAGMLLLARRRGGEPG